VTKQVMVLGGGMVGSAAASDLAHSGFEVTQVDASPKALERAAAKGLRTMRADLGRPDAVTEAVAGADLVVGALPSALGLQTLRAVIAAGKPYCDISFMPEDAWELDELAKSRGVCAVTDCGVAPGVSNLLAGYAAHVLDPCDSIEIYVGGLPLERHWPFEYKAGFAPFDVIEEYTRPARIVEGGRVVIKEALSEPELMNFPGIGTLEAFNTDGLRSLAYTLKVPDMKEKTLRYPGHIELMRVLRQMGLFSKEPIEVKGQKVVPLDVTAALLFPLWTFGPGEADVTVMRVTAAGKQQGRPTRLTWDLCDRHDAGADLRSMSRTTAFAATSMATLMARGVVSRPGVHQPEVLAREPGLLAAFLEEYERRGVRVTASES
jgi:saccharopine dehydrogenase-like NADP-dependent oxidoreductase